MKRDDIEIGVTYLFVGSDSPKRKHLAGQPFTVQSKGMVYRKVKYRHKKRSMKVARFFNDDGVGARAEELEALPKDFTRCNNCGCWSDLSKIEPTTEKGPINCPECGEDIALRLTAYDPHAAWLEATTPPDKEGFYNVITHENRLIIAAYQLGEWDCEMMAPTDRVVRYNPNTFQLFEDSETQCGYCGTTLEPNEPCPKCFGDCE